MDISARAGRIAAVVAGGLMAASVGLSAWAQDANLQEVAHNWVNHAVASNTAPTVPLRMEVVVGALDNRLRLAPCAAVEPYLPVGARLWGRSRIGLRCTDGMVRWNVSLPLTVNAYGPAWVLKNPLTAGTTVTENDVVQAEVNWAEDASPILHDRTLWLGQVATRSLLAGQALRHNMLRPAQVFQVGATVRVVVQGAGFSVTGEAQAMSAGVVGQVARLRFESGKLASGTVLDANTVRIDL